ncbi:hypothetical protein GCM10009801_59170 [Streptomyces albiaxialis]|uniref:Flavoprotein domain-containing protein n=1 Tax=Streptomyces albiaxialis TaxID=329523 RepID=A0ABN2WIT1_9ACTN
MRDDTLSVLVCGSSAASNLPSYLTWLHQEIDLPLRVLLTHSAERFVPRELVAWHVDEIFTSDDPGLNPTEFARRSLAVVVLPATAHMLASAALGLGGSPAQTVLLAAERPALFFPSMNGIMWARKSTARHVEALRADGHTVVEPRESEVYELWQREVVIGPALLPPDQAAETVVKWVEAGLPAD